MQPAAVLARAFASHVHFRGKGRAVQGDRHAISGKRWNHRCLIAHTPQTEWPSGKIAIRNGRDSQWPLPQGYCTLQTLLYMPVVIEYRCQQLSPAADLAQPSSPDYKAQVGHISFHQREASISAGEEKYLDELSQRLGLGTLELPVQFEGDEVALPGARTLPPVEVVFSVGRNTV